MTTSRPLTSVFLRTLALLAIVLAGCIEEPEPKLRIGTFQRPGFEPLFLARSLGYYDEQHIQLVEFPSAAEMLLAYRNRAINAATVTTDDVLRLAADGQAERIVLLLGTSHGADAVLAKPPITDVAQLKGRGVALESNSLGGYVLARALDSAGLTLADVKIISGRIDRHDRELTVGTADAVVTYEPYRSRILRRGTAVVFDSSKIPDEIAEVLIVSAALADQPSAALLELKTGWFRALEYLAAHPDDAAQRMAPREAVTPEQFRESLSLVHFADLAENRRQLAAPDVSLLTQMRRMADFMVKTKMLAQPVDPAPLISDRLIREGAR